MKIRAIVLSLMKIMFVGYFSFFILYVYNIIAYKKQIAVESSLWSILPGIFVTFTIIIVLIKLFVRKNDSEKKNLLEEVKKLSELFYDIAYWTPFLLFAMIALNTDLIILMYIGLALSGIAFAIIKIYDYLRYIKSSKSGD